MIRKQIYLEETTIRQIEQIANKQNVSQSEIIRQAIKDFIDKEQTNNTEDPLLELMGLFSSDITDSAVNHDKYIYGVE